MRIAVTGGAGFIGGRLCALLASQGHDIAVIDKQALNPIDVTDRKAMIAACAGCDVIYHLAAEHRDDVRPRAKYFTVNRDGTANVIAAAKANNIDQIIFTSTVAVYGLTTQNPSEDSIPHPHNDYAQSKWEAEYLLTEWAHESPERICTIVRACAVFGEGNRGNINTLITQIANGRFVMIGKGRNKKSLAYVGNVAESLAYCLNAQANINLYNYADKPDLSVRELTDKIYALLNRKRPALALSYPLGLAGGYVCGIAGVLMGGRATITPQRVRKFCANTTVDAQRYRVTGFTPRYTVDEGLARTIAADFPFAIEPGDEKADMPS